VSAESAGASGIVAVAAQTDSDWSLRVFIRR
jgi:hypothetical protein